MTELTIRLVTLLLSLESAVASALDAALGVASCDASGCDDEAEPRQPDEEGRYCHRHQLISAFG